MSMSDALEAVERKSRSKRKQTKVIDRARRESYCDELLIRITADQKALSASACHLKHLLKASHCSSLPTWLQRLFGGSSVPDSDEDDTYCLRLRALADLHRLTEGQLARLTGDVGALRAAPGTRTAAKAFRQHARATRHLGRTVAGLVWHLKTTASMLARACSLRGGARAVVSRDLVALVAGHEYKICWHFERV